ncbi:MAG: F0F1 ATP synthase subunit gamma [Campylobacterales bacterium]|nr:F0F1 ATP synthase subunit gamma [Campylobacterales bacterium]
MANLKEIQRQIKSVSNTQKTTRAMKLVSTAKLKRAKELAERSSVFASKLNEVISDISTRIQCQKIGGVENRACVEIDNPQMVDLIFVTADKGLCGGFNFQTLKAVKTLMAEYKDKKVKVRLRGVGKKGIEFFIYNEVEMLDTVKDLSSMPDMDRAAEFIQSSMKDYMEGKIDGVTIVYNGFKNALVQELHVKQILPIAVSCNDEVAASSMLEIEAEDSEKMLNSLIAKYVEYNMYYSLIDSLAAEHSARMQAMDAATNNAKEIVKTLNVQFNKARQGAITTELIEIISGVESMK